MIREIILGQLRHLLTIAGPLLAARSGFDPAAVETMAGALITFAGAAWSAADKMRARRT